jgi:arylsulfatase A-like enzyme
MTRTQRSARAAPIAGATIAALAVGLGEATLVAVERHLGLDPGLLFFAVLFYGLAGVTIGVGAAVALAAAGRALGRAVTPPVAYAVSGAATLSVLVTIIGRFRVFRDVLHETFDGQIMSARTFQLGSLAAFLVLFLLAFVILRLIARKPGPATSAVAVLAGLVVALVGAGTAMRLVPPPVMHVRPASGPIPSGPSVILIMADTLRADHLSCYGSANRTPAIDALAADGTRFAHTFSQASWTRPSVATILTSLYPSSHQAVHKSDILPDAVITLPEVMQASGYRTIGYANNINVAPLFNFQQGFDEYVFLEPSFFFGATEAAAQLTMYNQLRLIRERYFSKKKYVENYYQPAEVVTDRGLDWITRNAGERPFFMFLHYMDAHDPYFIHPFNGEAFARVADPNPDPKLADRYRAAYDGAIRYLDEQIGRLLAELKQRGLYDRTLIVLTADHGEEFCEHGGWWHGTTLYDEQIGVPLIVKPPRGGATNVVSEALVSSIDIAPTILAGTGIAAPDVMQGKALALQADGASPRDHTFAETDLEGNVLQSFRTDDWKLIQANPGNPRGLAPRELFEIARDPHEQRDLATTRTDEVATLAAHIAALQSHAEAVAVTGSETVVDPGSQERLRQLGYIQ